eukprot:5240967-Amphidinium_carterae.1
MVSSHQGRGTSVARRRQGWKASIANVLSHHAGAGRNPVTVPSDANQPRSITHTHGSTLQS